MYRGEFMAYTEPTNPILKKYQLDHGLPENGVVSLRMYRELGLVE